MRRVEMKPRQRSRASFSSLPSSCLDMPGSAKLCFVGAAHARAPRSDAGVGKQSFQDKCVTKLELGHEGGTRRFQKIRIRKSVKSVVKNCRWLGRAPPRAQTISTGHFGSAFKNAEP